MNTIWVISATIKIPLSSSGNPEEREISPTWSFQEVTEEGVLNWNLKDEEGWIR